MSQSQRGRLCLVTAAEIEFNHIVKALRPEALIGRELDTRLCRANLSGKYGKRQIVVLQSEMGAPDFAHRLQRHLAIFPYDGLIVIGLAGALAPDLKAGDLVLYEHCLFANVASSNGKYPMRACDAAFAGWIESALAAQNLKTHRICGLAVNEVITRASDKAALYVSTQAAAVDMESGIVAEALKDYPMPFVSLRVIVDEAALNLPDFNHGLRADGRYDARKMLRVMVARPADCLKFLWRLRKATKQLRAVTKALLKAP
ncbi:MAG: hypothetical protein HOP19_18690 [Acidobacteria bacterium]|nr:hypothetical protein [Acidobacteriota bacterium]